jgi:flavin-dependent dehydrogenase
MQAHDLVIVGSGPSGISTALSLVRLDPAWAGRLVVLEKEHHPRPKLCGGGVTFTADPVLKHLDLSLDALGVPSVPIHTVRVKFEELYTDVHFPNVFRVLRRDELDGALVREARARGVRVEEGVKVERITPRGDHVHLQTSAGELRAQAVVGADGSKGVVRRHMELGEDQRVSRLVELLTPEDPAQTPEFTEHRAVFDFSPYNQKVQGYYWDFPSFKQGRAYMNRGVFDSRVHPEAPRADLKGALEEALEERDRRLGDHELMGHPERWYDPEARCANPRLLLVGDAAGVEPLLGEGISWALRYGPFAARYLHDAMGRGDLSFSDYEAQLRTSPLGKELALRVRLARFCYRQDRRFYRMMWPSLKLASRFVAWKSQGAL